MEGSATHPALTGIKRHFSSLAILQSAMQDFEASRLAAILVSKLEQKLSKGLVENGDWFRGSYNRSENCQAED